MDDFVYVKSGLLHEFWKSWDYYGNSLNVMENKKTADVELTYMILIIFWYEIHVHAIIFKEDAEKTKSNITIKVVTHLIIKIKKKTRKPFFILVN